MTRDNAQTASASEGDVARFLWASAPRRRELYAILRRAFRIRHPIRFRVARAANLLAITAGPAFVVSGLGAYVVFDHAMAPWWTYIIAIQAMCCWLVLSFLVGTALRDDQLREVVDRLPHWYRMRWRAFSLSPSQRDRLDAMLKKNDTTGAWLLILRLSTCWPDSAAARWMCSSGWGGVLIRLYCSIVALAPIVSIFLFAEMSDLVHLVALGGVFLLLVVALALLPFAFVADHQMDVVRGHLFGEIVGGASLCANCRYPLHSLRTPVVDGRKEVQCPECGLVHRA